jgi:hypothetical protein
LVTPLTGVAPSAAQETQHCPGHSSAVKVNGQGTQTVTVGSRQVTLTVSGSTVTFSKKVKFCVKASTGISGVKVGRSYTVDFTNPGGQVPDISYVVIYKVRGHTPPPPPECPYPPCDEYSV